MTIAPIATTAEPVGACVTVVTSFLKGDTNSETRFTPFQAARFSTIALACSSHPKKCRPYPHPEQVASRALLRRGLACQTLERLLFATRRRTCSIQPALTVYCSAREPYHSSRSETRNDPAGSRRKEVLRRKASLKRLRRFFARNSFRV